MTTNKYQVWEGEMEAAGIEENGVSFLAAIFSAMLGILLFAVLIAKTILEATFKIKIGVKRNVISNVGSAQMSVSFS